MEECKNPGYGSAMVGILAQSATREIESERAWLDESGQWAVTKARITERRCIYAHEIQN